MTTSVPSIADIRRIGQPPAILGRADAEHWAGLVYARRVSPYLTKVLLRLGLSANAVTWLMIASGLVAAGWLSFGGVWPVLGAFLLIQVQLLLDCSDGEIARINSAQSPAGIYLDRIGHYTTEAALPIALGIRADGGWSHMHEWTMLGLVTAVFVLLVKAETDLVHVARMHAKLPMFGDEGKAFPRVRALRWLRSLARRVPFYRVFIAIEFTVIGLVAVVIDAVTDGVRGSRWWLLVALSSAAVTSVGHLASIVTGPKLVLEDPPTA
ncbi:MAG: CDP-alcohol phosphatidyltransferase family protein [Frankiales bacterium]|nr:CDP-alcohol phosphatidyltransferase family protein [Frankiales bacterium]